MHVAAATPTADENQAVQHADTHNKSAQLDHQSQGIKSPLDLS